MVIKTIKFQKASSCTYILTLRLRTYCVVDLKLPIVSIVQTGKPWNYCIFFERFKMLIQSKIYGIFMVDRASPEYLI